LQPEEQQKLQESINQWIRHIINVNKLKNTMNKLSEQAEANGLTQEILPSILEEDPFVNGLFAGSSDLSKQAKIICQQEVQPDSGWTWKTINRS
jgi:hypothetical protein